MMFTQYDSNDCVINFNVKQYYHNNRMMKVSKTVISHKSTNKNLIPEITEK